MTVPSHDIKRDLSIQLSTAPDVRQAPDANWQARRELASALRRLNTAVMTADVPAEHLQALNKTISAESKSIESCQRLAGRGDWVARNNAQPDAQKADLLYELSPAIGLGNAQGIPMHIWFDGAVTRAEFTPDWTHEGPIGHLHGGIIAMFFDQILGVAQRSVSGFGRTAMLTIRYHHPTPLHVPLRLEAKVMRVDGRKKYLEGALIAGDIRTASCEGLFIGDKESA